MKKFEWYVRTYDSRKCCAIFTKTKGWLYETTSPNINMLLVHTGKNEWTAYEVTTALNTGLWGSTRDELAVNIEVNLPKLKQALELPQAKLFQQELQNYCKDFPLCALAEGTN